MKRVLITLIFEMLLASVMFAACAVMLVAWSPRMAGLGVFAEVTYVAV